MSDTPDPHATSPASAWRVALLRTLSGCLLGLLTAAVLIMLGKTWWPGLPDAGIDAGMRLKVGLDRLASLADGMPQSERGAPAAPGFVFLDIDPERPERPEPAAPGADVARAYGSVCEALAARQPGEFILGRREVAADAGAAPHALRCASSQVLDRRMLAAVVTALRTRGPRLIVLDVELAEADAPPDETDVLADALRQHQVDGKPAAPVVYAAPVQELSRQDPPSERRLVRLEGEGGAAPRFAAAARPAVALPEPGQPVRRYPRCFDVQGRAGATLPSLPALAAAIATDEPLAVDAPCEQVVPPRIVYTLPPMNAHQDDLPGSAQRADWAYYRRVFNRCLGGRLWDKGSPCGVADAASSAFRDKVVVVGTSNPVRRDWHATPLGNMVGAEVVVNAIRSFIEYPHVHDKSIGELLAGKSLVVVCGSAVWFVFHLWRLRSARARRHVAATRLSRARRGLAVTAAFLATLAVVVALTLRMSFNAAAPTPSLDVLLGVLAISLEQYVEAAHWVIHGLERIMARLLGLADHAKEH